MTLKHKKCRGFSLVELLVVVGVLGILSMMVTYNLRMAKHRAKVGKAMSEMRIIKLAVETYRLDNGFLPPDVDGFIPFILTDSISKPIAYLNDNRTMKDPLNDFVPKPKQWRFQTYRYVNIKGHLNGIQALRSSRDPNEWLPIPMRMWREAHEKYGDYLISSTHIKYKDNFKRDEAGRVKAMSKWNEFFWKEKESRPKFMELDDTPMISHKLSWTGFEKEKDDEENSISLLSD